MGCIGLCWTAVQGPHDLLRGVGCTTKFLMGRGVVDEGSSERCLSGLVKSHSLAWQHLMFSSCV